MKNKMPPLEAIKSLCFVQEYGYGYEYEIIENTLQQYKSIEEELGIDLITLFKALKNGCYFKETFDYMGKTHTQIIFTKFTYLYYEDDIGAYFIHTRTKEHYLENYGKTWALTKEELL